MLLTFAGSQQLIRLTILHVCIAVCLTVIRLYSLCLLYAFAVGSISLKPFISLAWLNFQ